MTGGRGSGRGLAHERMDTHYWNLEEKLKWEAKAKTDSHVCLETGLYLAFSCAMICEHWFMGMSSIRDKFWKEKH